MRGYFLAFFFFLGMVFQAEARPLKVVSFSTILSDLAKNIGGSKISLVSLIKPGVDPHEFEPTPEDMNQVEQSDLILLSGKGMEGYLAKLKQGSANGKFILVGEAVASLSWEEKGKKTEDPHWWHSIANVKRATEVIRDAFIEADPDQAKWYQAQSGVYLGKLDELEGWAKEQMAGLPRQKRKLVTSHDAFQYFARDYGFQIYPIEGISSADEPSSQKVGEIIETIKREGVKAVFFESMENPKVVTSITRESGAKIGGELYADGLGDKVATTYIEMMHHNITTIIEGLK